MSSARSVASSRAKRAGPTDIKPNYSSIQSNISTIPTPNPADKLSISHAITLITLRLGKIETYIQKLELEILPDVINSTPMENSLQNNFSQNNSNISYQPLEDKINYVMNKIKLLESENLLLHNKIQILELQTIPKEDLQSIPKEELNNSQENLIESLNKEELLNELKEHILPFENELTKIKDLLLYLQHHSLEINQKLINVLFNNNINSDDSNSEDANNNEIIEVIEDEINNTEVNNLTEVNEIIIVDDLKEIINEIVEDNILNNTRI